MVTLIQRAAQCKERESMFVCLLDGVGEISQLINSSFDPTKRCYLSVNEFLLYCNECRPLQERGFFSSLIQTLFTDNAS